jgi:hypothetical protein
MGLGKTSRDIWAVGEPVWVWDTDVPEKDAEEGDETWRK